MVLIFAACSVSPSKPSQKERIPTGDTVGLRADANDAMRAFQRTAAVVLGASYETLQEDENPACLAGVLDFVPTGPTFTVMLGGRALISGVKDGVFEDSYKERSCSYEERVETINNKVKSSQKRVCQQAGRPIERITLIEAQFAAQEIRYTINIKENRKTISQTECVLQKGAE